MATVPIVQTQELTKHYFHPSFSWLVRAKALTDLTLTIERGEVFGLLGPNGSGKSTTIKLILGLIFPTRGHVAVFGKRPEDLSNKALVGYLPEESRLYRFLTAEETLDFYGRLFGLSRHERHHRIEALLDLVGLRSERKRPLSEFSKGMQRRIGLAQALINDPELVILDEPTSGLDPLGTREVKDLILELKAKGKTVILSSHLLADVEDVCDRVCILYGGHPLAMGPLREILSRRDRIQIIAEMDPAMVQEITTWIRNRRGENARVQVTLAMERLESFFIRIVREAEQRGIETSGVRGAKGTLDFLKPVSTPSLLERLVKGEEEKTSPPSSLKEAPSVDSHVASQALASLVSPTRPSIEPQPSESPTRPREDVDHDLLHRLTQKES